jgi:hypothetical protein
MVQIINQYLGLEVVAINIFIDYFGNDDKCIVIVKYIGKRMDA